MRRELPALRIGLPCHHSLAVLTPVGRLRRIRPPTYPVSPVLSAITPMVHAMTSIARWFRSTSAAVLAVFLAFLPAWTVALGAEVSVGSSAPVFTAVDDAGQPWKSTDHVGREIVVVYFYPADMTGGCTKQACGYRDDMQALRAKSVTVVGVSGDSVRNHQLFKQAHSLDFTLLADPDGKVAEAFGVPFTVGDKVVSAEIGGKNEQLARALTTKRWTFVIDTDGKVIYKNTEVKAAEDSKAILKLLASRVPPTAASVP